MASRRAASPHLGDRIPPQLPRAYSTGDPDARETSLPQSQPPAVGAGARRHEGRAITVCAHSIAWPSGTASHSRLIVFGGLVTNTGRRSPGPDWPDTSAQPVPLPMVGHGLRRLLQPGHRRSARPWAAHAGPPPARCCAAATTLRMRGLVASSLVIAQGHARRSARGSAARRHRTHPRSARAAFPSLSRALV